MGKYKCEVCGDCFDESMKLRNHRRRAHKDWEVKAMKPVYDIFRCQYCNKGNPSNDARRKCEWRCKKKVDAVREVYHAEEAS